MAASGSVNPLDPSEQLKRPLSGASENENHPQSEILHGDSATTRAEKLERHPPPDIISENTAFLEPAPKRAKVENLTKSTFAASTSEDRQRGAAPIKAEYVPTAGASLNRN